MSSKHRKSSYISRRGRKHLASRKPRLESLESRVLMAADLIGAEQAIVAEGEGESTPLASLADFANALTAAGVKFYGSDSCPVCARQKALFGADEDLLPYINVTNPDGSLNEIGQAEGISSFPTWEFPDGEREIGFLSLSQLATESGVPLPTNVVVLNTNQGDNIEIKLRPDAAPQTVENFLNYVNDGDYDNTIFHRLAANFVLQGGGFATTSETFTSLNQLVPIPTDPPVVNEFNLSNTRATVAMAKLGGNPDSATSQFFFNLLDNSSNLDNQNGGFTVFAEVLDMAFVDQLAQTSRFNLDNGGVFASVPIANNNELLVIRNLDGSGQIQGTAFEDANGDGIRDPGENPIENMTIYVDANDNGVFDAGELSATSDANGAYSIVAPSGVRVVRFELAGNEFPTTGNAGRHAVNVDIGGTTSLDIGRVTVTAVADIDLHEDSDTGASSTDNITTADNSSLSRALDFVVTGAIPGAVVRIFSGDTQLGQATADANGEATVRTNGNFELDGLVTLTAEQQLNNVVGPRTTSLDITIDDAGPVFSTTSPTLGKVAVEYAYDADTNEEGGGLTYSLENAPAGAVIDASTGELSWTPTADQVGDHVFEIAAEDTAGNKTTQQVNVQVLTNEQLIVRLEVTDVQGNVITEIDAGEQFFVRGLVSDNRLSPEGVGAAFIDLIYQNQLVIPEGTINYGANFPDTQSGDISTLGVVDELGAAGNTTIVGADELLLFEVVFSANIGGEEVFTGESADIFPAHDSFLLGDANPAVPDVIKIESTSVTINLSFGANGDKFGIDENSGELNFDVLANDQRFENSQDDLIISGSSLSTQGATVRIADDGGSIFYTPPQGFVGVDTFTYSVTDGNGTDSATVIVNVLDVNDPPTANADVFDLDEDASETLLDVILNDSILPDVGETLQIISFTTPDNGGSVRLGGAGAFLLYTPGADVSGVDTFTYTIEDSRGETATGTVTVNLAGINDAPDAVNDTFDIDEDGPATIFRPLDNDTDADADSLTIVSVTDVPASQGVLTIVDNGQGVEFTPASDFQGAVIVGYTISDGNGGEDGSTIIIRVASVNDPPTAANDIEVITKNTGPHSFAVLDNDSIAPDDGETLTITNVTGATNGAVSINTNGDALIYTPNADFVGEETITYTISDGRGGEDTATLTITVRDFVPGSLGGEVFIDANGNGVRDAGETPVGGVSVKLSGQDTFGESVSIDVVTDGAGRYSFPNLAPGSYFIKQTQPDHLINGASHVGTQGGENASENMLQIDLEEGVNGENNNFSERGRQAKLVRLSDFFLRPAIAQAELFENTATGETSFALGYGWDDVRSILLTTPDDGQGNAVLEVVDNTGTQSVIIPLERIETRVSGNQTYNRILSSLAELHATTDSTPQGEGERSAAPQGEGERFAAPQGEPTSSFTANAAATNPLDSLFDDSAAMQAEGESPSRQPQSSNAAELARVLRDTTDDVFEVWSENSAADSIENAFADDGDSFADDVDELLSESDDNQLTLDAD